MGYALGWTADEMREFVHEYELVRYGGKTAWLAERGVSYNTLERWRSAVFEGDLDRGLIPREGGPVTVPPSKRRALERQRAEERATHEAEVARLQARVRELEETNDALGKAIGLLHQLSEQEPDANPTPTGPSDS
jgi:transposase-like protein